MCIRISSNGAIETDGTENLGMTMDAPALAAALARDALEVHYQPIVVLPARQVVGFEALARLRDVDGSLIPPAQFIPVAEKSGLIVSLGFEVLRRAVIAAAAWRSTAGALTTATVSVNIAAAQLEQPDVVDQIIAVLDQQGVPGSALILEITESANISPDVRAAIEQLAALGIRVAIDDFGTGFATLDLLRRFPVQILKLDRSFVAGVTREGADRAIIRAVIQLAASLGLSVVAEGIETEEQAIEVLRLGCAAMQGYLFARAAADPPTAAAAVVAGRSSLGEAGASGREGGTDRWSVALEEAVIAAARLLGARDSAQRGAVYALATALARAARLDDHTARVVGRLALVHDVGRLMVDGRLPLVLHEDELLRALTEARSESEAQPEPVEISLVRAAVRVVEGAAQTDPQLPEATLAAALHHEAGRCDSAPLNWPPNWPLNWAGILTEVAKAPPGIVQFGALMDDLDRRRMGRQGMEERMRSVFGITKVLSTSRDTRELMRVALEEVRQIVGASAASVERWERESNQLRCLVNVGQLAPSEVTFPQDEVYPLADYAAARRTMLTGLPYINSVHDQTMDDDATALLVELGRDSSASVPIYVDGRIWGQLWFATDHGEPPLEAKDIETLMAVATLMGGVVVQADNLLRVDRMAFEDALTQVGNRRAVDDVLDRLSNQEEQVVVALVDLDRLKEINDTEGHAAGDDAIRDVADALSESVTTWPRATVGRLGGDEFCVVLPGCPLEEARRMVASALVRVRSSGGPSVSMGLAITGPGPWAPRDVLAVADEELYRAKRIAHAGCDQADHRQEPRLTRPRRHTSSPSPH